MNRVQIQAKVLVEAAVAKARQETTLPGRVGTEHDARMEPSNPKSYYAGMHRDSEKIGASKPTAPTKDFDWAKLPWVVAFTDSASSDQGETEFVARLKELRYQELLELCAELTEESYHAASLVNDEIRERPEYRAT
jgi:hypothetical protein